MNILYIEHYAGGPKYGMEFRPHYLSREWVSAGHSVTIVAASYSHVRSNQPKTSGRFTSETIDGVRYVWCETPTYSANGLGRAWNIAVFLHRVSQYSQWLDFSPDAVIASSTYPADIFVADRIAKKFNAKLVWEVHDLWPLSLIELAGMSPRHPFCLLMQFAENAACGKADVVISMLPKTDLHLKMHGMNMEKFHYIPNGVDPADWKTDVPIQLPVAHLEAIQKARAKGHMLIGYAGNHGMANALNNALEAAVLTRDDPITWILVGAGPEKPQLLEAANAKGLKNFVLLDQIPKATIPALLHSMDALYIGWHRVPMYRFGICPNKLIDYMMSGVPIIHAVEAGNDPVAEANCGTTIEPENPLLLAETARRICTISGKERAELGRNGRNYAEENHIYSTLAEKFIDAIRRTA